MDLSPIIPPMTRQSYNNRQNIACTSLRSVKSKDNHITNFLNVLKSLLKDFTQEHQSLEAENQLLQKRYAKLLQENQRLTYEVNHDSLTGLHNRRYLNTYIKQSCTAASLKGQRLSLLMIDIDHFKQYNDTYGHQTGDQLLQKVGNKLFSTVQTTDNCIARYGGEEFVVILPGYRQAEALRIAQKIQTSIQRLGVTVSIGIAVYGQDGRTPLDLVHCADHRLYTAKRNGRNRIEISDR